MGSWSPENATKAYITTLKMEKKENEPDSAEFISALAAGNNAQMMIVACAEDVVENNILALVAAANQTGGSVHCILPSKQQLQTVKNRLKCNTKCINFVTGVASDVLTEEKYREADFLLVDCNILGYEQIMRRATTTQGVKKGGVVVVGFNAFCKGSSWQWSGLRTHLLPIGDGLLVTRIDGDSRHEVKSVKRGGSRKSNWIVKVDQCTGEEHVFRVRSSSHRKLEVSI